MDVPVSQLEERFDELVRASRSGEPVTVIKDGRSVAMLTAVAPPPRPLNDEEFARRLKAIRSIQQAVRKQFEGREMPTSDHSDLYDEFGLPT